MLIKVSIVEDDPATRENLMAIINRSDDLTGMETYPSAEDAIRGVPKNLPDVLLVDINLGRRSGIECVAVLKAAHPKLQMMMVTTYDDTKLIFEALRAGASGYLLKRTPAAEIVAAIKEVHEGGSPMSAQIARKVVSHFHPSRSLVPEMETLTPREHEILTLLAKGLQYKEIADHLDISTSTVRGHLHLIYGKLHVQSRTEAVLKYLGR
ncbi:MAG TPA: response regulator transcription factor [Candidatus Saccharimonadia bacterium]|nr:response regulator transcription factor [Candidatus Saccharimonadia bacterium]